MERKKYINNFSFVNSENCSVFEKKLFFGFLGIVQLF